MLAERRLHPGRILKGKWRIERLLGEGGMATVWAATHRNGHAVAIKALRPGLDEDPRVCDRFLREGYVANRIDHPGVVKVLDDDTIEDGLVFLVMELLEGKSLKQHWTEAKKQLPEQEVVAIADATLEVLSAAHRAGVVHRDIKPDNIFLPSGGGLKLLDFGIARLRELEGMEQVTQTGAMLGTPAFMAPEQALGHWERVDARTDVFGIGTMMWTLLTGELVHEATTLQELLVAAGSKPARALRNVVPRIDPRLAAVIDKALAFEPDARWPSAAEMKAALTATDIAHEPIRWSPQTAVPAPLQPSRARTRRRFAAVAALACVATGAWLATFALAPKTPTTAASAIPESPPVRPSEEPPSQSARAVPSAPSASAAPPKRASPPAPPFHEGEARQRLAAGARSARGVCSKMHGEPRSFAVAVTWDKSGRAVGASGGHSPAEMCAQNILRSVAVPPFRGGTVTLTQPIVLDPLEPP